jgi:UDP-N-acetylmuramoyl-L-alanyl-D-glutamate--2,6-diaminopimelate ligase
MLIEERRNQIDGETLSEAPGRLLDALIAAVPQAEVSGDVHVPVTDITEDSREVKIGSLFVAYKGVSVDGHRFIAEALQRGATAVVAEAGSQLPHISPGFPLIVVPSGRQALAHLCAAWHGFPARNMTMIGVTGTDGKTTTVNLIHRILRAAGHRTGMISTVNAIIGERVQDTGLHTTTPDAPDVQRYLAEMVEARATHAVLEVTSEGLAQGRATACDFDVAAVTNITHEHLYAHGTFDNYREAKALLFRGLASAYRKSGRSKVAVLNADDASYEFLRSIPADQHLSYGLDQPSEVSAAFIHQSASAAWFTARTPEAVFLVRMSLLGRHNVYNCLAAITVTLALGVEVQAIQQGIASLQGIRGRMERIDVGQPFTVIVDFAHTPGGLEAVLNAVRKMTQGRVWVVFGCAGLRDVRKRPMMGEIASRLADFTVLTAEDPRTECLDEILAQIAEGCDKQGAVEGERFWRIGDREEAIRHAIGGAQPGDLVVVTGKGHERSMCFGTTEYPWSDQQSVREALEELAR